MLPLFITLISVPPSETFHSISGDAACSSILFTIPETLTSIHRSPARFEAQLSPRARAKATVDFESSQAGMERHHNHSSSDSAT